MNKCTNKTNGQPTNRLLGNLLRALCLLMATGSAGLWAATDTDSFEVLDLREALEKLEAQIEDKKPVEIRRLSLDWKKHLRGIETLDSEELKEKAAKKEKQMNLFKHFSRDRDFLVQVEKAIEKAHGVMGNKATLEMTMSEDGSTNAYNTRIGDTPFDVQINTERVSDDQYKTKVEIVVNEEKIDESKEESAVFKRLIRGFNDKDVAEMLQPVGTFYSEKIPGLSEKGELKFNGDGIVDLEANRIESIKADSLRDTLEDLAGEATLTLAELELQLEEADQRIRDADTNKDSERSKVEALMALADRTRGDVEEAKEKISENDCYLWEEMSDRLGFDDVRGEMPYDCRKKAKEKIAKIEEGKKSRLRDDVIDKVLESVAHGDSTEARKELAKGMDGELEQMKNRSQKALMDLFQVMQTCMRENTRAQQILSQQNMGSVQSVANSLNSLEFKDLENMMKGSLTYGLALSYLDESGSPDAAADDAISEVEGLFPKSKKGNSDLQKEIVRLTRISGRAAAFLDKLDTEARNKANATVQKEIDQLVAQNMRMNPNQNPQALKAHLEQTVGAQRFQEEVTKSLSSPNYLKVKQSVDLARNLQRSVSAEYASPSRPLGSASGGARAPSFVTSRTLDRRFGGSSVSGSTEARGRTTRPTGGGWRTRPSTGAAPQPSREATTRSQSTGNRPNVFR